LVNILSISCFHSDIENLLNFIDRFSSFNIDIVVCPGDFTDNYLPKGFSRADLAAIIIEELSILKKPIIAVPGSWDGEIIDFLEKKGVSVHGKGKVVDKIGFYGFGGARTPFNTPFEPEESEISAGLEKAFNAVKNAEVLVQVTHAPPARTGVDIISTGAHVGSDVVRKFIEEKQPTVAICSHIHEGRGVDEIGKTKIVNSGRFPEGYCGLINIENKSVQAKIINLI
jgi:Icc-related predicted phosphoesterase